MPALAGAAISSNIVGYSFSRPCIYYLLFIGGRSYGLKEVFSELEIWTMSVAARLDQIIGPVLGESC
jgi:hypothetical protein